MVAGGARWWSWLEPRGNALCANASSQDARAIPYDAAQHGIIPSSLSDQLSIAFELRPLRHSVESEFPSILRPVMKPEIVFLTNCKSGGRAWPEPTHASNIKPSEVLATAGHPHLTIPATMLRNQHLTVYEHQPLLLSYHPSGYFSQLERHLPPHRRLVPSGDVLWNPLRRTSALQILYGLDAGGRTPAGTHEILFLRPPQPLRS